MQAELKGPKHFLAPHHSDRGRPEAFGITSAWSHEEVLNLMATHQAVTRIYGLTSVFLLLFFFNFAITVVTDELS